MKFLHVLPYSPVPPDYGGAIRIFHILKNMAKHHEVTVLAFGNPEDYFKLRGNFNGGLKDIHLVPKRFSMPARRILQFYSHWTSHSFFHHLLQSRKMQETLDRLLEKQAFDIVQTEFAHLGVLKFQTNAIKILDAHNVEYDNFRRIWLNERSPLRRHHYHLEYQKFYREEIEFCRKQDAIFTTSARDRDLLDQDVPEVPKYVVPNGVDASYFTPGKTSTEPNTIIFTGLLNYVPNHDGVMYFLDEIFPKIKQRIPDARLYIVGKKPFPSLVKRARNDVIVTGYVPDVRPFIDRASVYVVPLRMGGGTRLKVVEAMAMKKPIVTTSIGSEGIDVADGVTALVRNNPDEFADAVIRLLMDSQLRSRLAAQGYELMRTSYEWSVIGEQQERYYQEIVRHARHHAMAS